MFYIDENRFRLQHLLSEASSDSYRNLMMLKLILTSGLYPQIAVEDEYNCAKTVSDKLYHTKNNSYVFLKQLSYFATNPDALELHSDDIEVPPTGEYSVMFCGSDRSMGTIIVF